MSINPVNKSFNHNNPAFKAKFELVANGLCLPDATAKHLHKFAKTIGTEADKIFVGMHPKCTSRTALYQDVFGRRFNRRTIESVDTSFSISVSSPTKNFFQPLIEKIIPGTKYPEAIYKYSEASEIRLNNYKIIYKTMMDLRDKLKVTL